MTREDIRIIFNNVADLAMFSDSFTEQIEEALGSVLEGGSGEDHVGALFLETVCPCASHECSLRLIVFSRSPLWNRSTFRTSQSTPLRWST